MYYNRSCGFSQRGDSGLRPLPSCGCTVLQVQLAECPPRGTLHSNPLKEEYGGPQWGFSWARPDVAFPISVYIPLVTLVHRATTNLKEHWEVVWPRAQRAGDFEEKLSVSTSSSSCQHKSSFQHQLTIAISLPTGRSYPKTWEVHQNGL